MTDNLAVKVRAVIERLQADGKPIPDEAVIITNLIHKQAMKVYLERGEFKTLAQYERQLWSHVRDFYSGETNAFEFIDDFVGSIDHQFGKAWNEGARAVEVDPKDFSEEDLAVLDEMIKAEREFILKFGEDIEAAVAAGVPVATFRSRVSVWANKYNEVVNKAKVYFGKKTKLEWQLGATEEHCETCARLNGIVAWAQEWEESGVKPQSAPNDDLECGGWRCDCSLANTDRRRTRGAFDKIMGIVGR